MSAPRRGITVRRVIPGRLALLDVETTGADPRRDRITEVGVLLVDDGALIQEWSTLVNPGRHIPSGIQSLTGITGAMVEHAPRFEDVAMDLAARINGRLLVAHNARFDYAFLRNEFRRAALPYRSEVLCTVRLSRALFPGHAKHNLDTLVERFALACDGRHRALADARLLLQLLRAMALHAAPDRLAECVAQVMQAPRAPPGVDPDLLDDIPDAPGIYQLFGESGTPLYAGRAASLRQQILTHFSEGGRHAGAQREAIRSGRLEWSATAGQLGASLRQLRIVERDAPEHNRPPRSSHEAWALHWKPNLTGEFAVTAVDLNHCHSPQTDLYGPFRSRTDALGALRALVREYRLCASAVGLEDAPCHGLCTDAFRGADVCRGADAGRGACVGREPPARHALRLMQALQRLRLPLWPYAGAVVLVEEDMVNTRSELHVLDRWRYLGSALAEHELDEWREARALPRFDVDIFRTLRRALAHGGYRVRDLAGCAEARD